MKNQQLAIEYSHENAHSFRNHNSRRRELWNLQSLESSPTQAAAEYQFARYTALHSDSNLPVVVLQ